MNKKAHHTPAQSDCNWSLQPIDWHGQPAVCLPSGSGPKGVYIYLRGLYGPRWGTYHPYPRSQLTANEHGGLKFAGVGPKSSTVHPRSARANPLWQPRALGIWGRYLPTKIPHLSGTPDCPWEWPPIDATLRDITLESFPSPYPNITEGWILKKTTFYQDW